MVASDESIGIGVIGLGSMGLGMATSMARRGVAVTGYDLDPDAVARLVAAGGGAAASAAEAARDADGLVVVVVNAAQTDAVLFGADGAAAAMQRGGVIVACATMAPRDAARLAEKAAALGLLYLDAPISGGAVKAAAGQLTVMASGAPAAFERAAPILDAIAATVHRLGDAAGIGASFKMVNQLLAGVHIAAACEAMTFAARLGLDLPKVYEVITGSAGNSWMFENRAPHILAGDYSPRSAVDIFTKDLGIVSDMGRQEKFPLQLSATALQMFIATAAAGMGRDDDASVARMIARLTGVVLPTAATEG
ncbi:MAG: L-threonate dehydrogenase [Roseiarcus sp.]